MQTLAGIVVILTGVVLILSLARIMQREMIEGKRPAIGMWLIFAAIVLIAGAGIAIGAYLLLTQ